MSQIKSLMLNAVSRVLSGCPRSWQWRIAGLVARCSILLGTRIATTTRINLEYCYPALSPSELKHRVRASLTQTLMLLLESGIIFHWKEHRLNGLIGAIHGEELLVEALSRQHGVILLVPHFGNWEFLALYLGRFNLVALYEPPKQQFLEAPIRASRERTGAKMVPTDRSGLRVALQTLHDGGLLGVLPDQVPDRRSGRHVPFFGNPALTMTLVHRLIRQTSAQVLQGSAVRTDSGFDLHFSKVDPQIGESDQEQALCLLNQEIEKLIEKAPDQYQWEYKRFKAPPEGCPKMY